MPGTEFTGGNIIPNDKFNFGRGNVGGGTGMIPWSPASIRDPFQFGTGPMTPAEAQAAIAQAVANPIAPVPFTLQGPRYRNGYHIEDVRIEDQQEQKPDNPGRRYVSASTWGRTIPISMGKRRLEGNILQSTALIPRLVGTTEYTVTYEIPVYEDPPLKPGGAVTVTYPGDDRPRPNPAIPQEGCDPGAASPCDTRADIPPSGPPVTIGGYYWTATPYNGVSCSCASPDETGVVNGPYDTQTQAIEAANGSIPYCLGVFFVNEAGGTYEQTLCDVVA